MTTPLTLEAVRAEFSQWRSTRTSTRETVPVTLQEHALALLHQHKQSHVISALGLNHSTLKRWQMARHQAAGFVSLPSTPDVFTASPSMQATIIHPNGLQLQLKAFSNQQLADLVQRLHSLPGVTQ